MSKIIEITCCCYCPKRILRRTGQDACKLTNKNIGYILDIPKWCPLEDKIEKSN